MKQYVITKGEINKLIMESSVPKKDMEESRTFSDSKFEKFAENAGQWLFQLAVDNPSLVKRMPGYSSFKKWITEINKSVSTDDDVLFLLPNSYSAWINNMDRKESNRIMKQTISMFQLGPKMSDKEESGKVGKHKNEIPVNVEPERTTEPVGTTEPQPPVEKRKRGRPPLPPELKKQKPVIQSKSEKIKSLEDRIAHLEDLLRKNNLMEEDRKIYEGRLRMMKDYQKFL